LETKRGPGLTLDRPVILFNDVIQIFDLADFNTAVMLDVIVFNGCIVSSALVDDYLVGRAILRSASSTGTLSYRE